MPPHGLWQISDSAFYGRFRRYLSEAGLPASGLHVLRHTAAKLRRDAGESVEEVSSFLDHSSLAVTSIYLRRLEGQPLPGDAELWDLPNVILSPHVGGRSAGNELRGARMFLDNLERWAHGRPLLHEVLA